MLAAGLIRQESTFQADIVSHANAVGLMQVLPKTGKLLAKQLKVRYAKAKLFDPEYNLELGMLYIAGLLKLDRRTRIRACGIQRRRRSHRRLARRTQLRRNS